MDALSIGNELFILTSSPVSIHHIHASHQKSKIIDLYEYFPLQKSIPQLKLNIRNEILYIHNAHDHTILALNLKTHKAFSISVSNSPIYL